jgi:hypothetical protein
MKSASAAPRESSTSLPNWHLTTFAARTPIAQLDFFVHAYP